MIAGSRHWGIVGIGLPSSRETGSTLSCCICKALLLSFSVSWSQDCSLSSNERGFALSSCSSVAVGKCVISVHCLEVPVFSAASTDSSGGNF